jgi:uncharacterized protein (DUF2126 family)
VSIQVALHHLTEYRYNRQVALGPQTIRLRPAPHSRTEILSHALRIEPARHFINWQQDPYANYIARVLFPEKTDHLKIEVDLIARMAVLNPFDFFLEPYAERFPFAYSAGQQDALAPYLATEQAQPQVAKYLEGIARGPLDTVTFLVDLNGRVARDVRYLIRLEPGVQTPEHTILSASGSCRDSAWLLVQLLRYLGLAARFVSGYLIQLVADNALLAGAPGPRMDFADLHAWCEVYLPGAGWIGLDPTSGLLAGEGHIPLACTAEPSAAAPVTGAVDPADVTFTYNMRVERVWEAPRVSKPFSEETWSQIEVAGRAVDDELTALDVRLTMGGEPTFVSVDDPQGAEWNTAALGENKRRLAIELFGRIRAHYARNSLAHFGQGKWYPGEPLPRWSLNCYWRKDGEAIWQDNALIADENTDGGANPAHAERFLATLASRLGLASARVTAAYEDRFHGEWSENRLPVNAPEPKPADPHTERGAREVQTQHPVGYFLPLARDETGTQWQTDRWSLRRAHCYLLPGDSPMGMRLPLDSLPRATPDETLLLQPSDPTQQFPALPKYCEITARLGKPAPATRGLRPFAAPRSRKSGLWVARTAICAQPRHGVLYVFLPPAEHLEDYLELVAAVESTAAMLSQPIIVEGYEPPSDPRIANFRVTPDPGVIEVNIHPSASWGELTERMTFLYGAARLSHLTAEKFMVDGQHTGTGGGNHVVLGGATPVDSPFLRRPDLLRSLLAYWHNHPSLSYLFSGRFIGPTSQAPRVDEARDDSLYELEIAFSQLPDPGAQCPAWLVDRLFRNLLIDVTGNTHRAEFCIDKLYSPDGPTGRLGLLELRAFEMPPHERMNLAQQLLLRSLVARFWRTPYMPVRLVRWGTQLHDRFMLPHFLLQDFADVIAEQNAAGHCLRTEWFAPQADFRFPHYGDFEARGTRVQLRQALEPWHVMGEEGTAATTARYVDSSLERLEVKVAGFEPERFLVTCNRSPIPLQATGVAGEYVAGVRYRAWRPESALHPSIGIHSPLTFDLFDTWMGRSLGGCRYHVTHPGGRNYTTLPVNALESESRRLARFTCFGHTPGKFVLKPARPSPEFPCTLDLRLT